MISLSNGKGINQMKNAANTFKEAKMMADNLSDKFKTPFGVVFDYEFDNFNNWRVALGKPKMAEYITRD